jgi:hypothetical protein
MTKRVTETGLDMASTVSLGDAKTKAQALRKQIAGGICPIQARCTNVPDHVSWGSRPMDRDTQAKLEAWR